MKTLKNILILLLLLALVGAIAYGLKLLADHEDNPSRYSHPITRQGAHW